MVSRVDEILARARSRISRYTPAEAAAADDLLLVDLRPRDSRERDGIIPGSVHVPRSVLEWRCDPDSGAANPIVADRSLPLVLVCEHGYSSSLAAASLADLGFERPGDLEGGFDAWRNAGLPVAAPPPPADGLPGMGGPEP
jgi:rhodanese-related sulfurtransferase